MTESRRTVRATPDFFGDLDRQLAQERGPDGEPSRGDFQAYELLRIVERFATGFDQLPESIRGRGDYRVLTIVVWLFRRCPSSVSWHEMAPWS